MTDWQWFWLWLLSVVLSVAAYEGGKWVTRWYLESCRLHDEWLIASSEKNQPAIPMETTAGIAGIGHAKSDPFDLRCFYCGFAKYYQDKRGARYAGEDGTTETCRRCNKPVRWESGAEEQARETRTIEEHLKATEKALYERDRERLGSVQQAGVGYAAIPTETIATEAIPTKTTAPQGPCKTCGGRMVFGDLSFCPDCTKHIRPLPYSLDLQGAYLTKANIVDFARIVGWHRIACWTGSRDALLGMPDNESNWASCDEASAWHRDRVRKERGQKDVLFGRPIKTTDYHPTDRLLAYDLAGDWTGQIINIGKYPQKADGE